MSGFLAQLAAFTRRNPIAVVSILLFLGLGISDYFLWKRQVELYRRHDRVQQQSNDQNLQLAGEARVQSQVDVVEKAVNHIEANLVPEPDLAGNSDYFYQFEKSTGVHLTDLSQLNSQSAGEDNPYRAIPFSVRLTGTFPQVLSFVRALEDGPRLLRIRRFSFARAPGSADSVGLDLTVEMLGHP